MIKIALSRVLLFFALFITLGCVSISNQSEYSSDGVVALELVNAYPSAIRLRWRSASPEGFQQYRLYVDTVSAFADSLEPHSVFDILSDTTITIEKLSPNTKYYFYLDIATTAGINRSKVIAYGTPPIEPSPFVHLTYHSMVRIPAGAFWYYHLKSRIDTIAVMSDSGLIDSLVPVNYNDSTVATISRDFYMDTVEVTTALWDSIMSDSIHGEQLPKVDMSWNEALLFCNERSKRDGLDTAFVYDSIEYSPYDGNILKFVNLECRFYCGGYRFPTEDEWTYAYRAGGSPGYYWGEETRPADKIFYPLTEADSVEMAKYIWWSENLSSEPPFEVAQKYPNAWGLYDMAGNVQEHLWNVAEFTESFENRMDYTGVAPLNSFNIRRKYKGGDFSDSRPRAFVDWALAKAFSASRIKKSVLGFRTVCTPLEIAE